MATTQTSQSTIQTPMSKWWPIGLLIAWLLFMSIGAALLAVGLGGYTGDSTTQDYFTMATAGIALIVIGAILHIVFLIIIAVRHKQKKRHRSSMAILAATGVKFDNSTRPAALTPPPPLSAVQPTPNSYQKADAELSGQDILELACSPPAPIELLHNVVSELGPGSQYPSIPRPAMAELPGHTPARSKIATLDIIKGSRNESYQNLKYDKSLSQPVPGVRFCGDCGRSLVHPVNPNFDGCARCLVGFKAGDSNIK
ncbi:hypothetical protein N7493_009820 [Penicillium malachiteum]|uniref:Uncharacterized protein n=1 Tax=Penicillium malachiteum TaxID=1324776 RepID=A0AAD6HDZ9_9EURO|nr:hypothetical protein N7493_009820 [Penicillium malachiteum]